MLNELYPSLGPHRNTVKWHIYLLKKGPCCPPPKKRTTKDTKKRMDFFRVRKNSWWFRGGTMRQWAPFSLPPMLPSQPENQTQADPPLTRAFWGAFGFPHRGK
jgi:hypothetical protein